MDNSRHLDVWEARSGDVIPDYTISSKLHRKGGRDGGLASWIKAQVGGG